MNDTTTVNGIEIDPVKTTLEDYFNLFEDWQEAYSHFDELGYGELYNFDIERDEIVENKAFEAAEDHDFSCWILYKLLDETSAVFFKWGYGDPEPILTQKDAITALIGNSNPKTPLGELFG